MNSLFRNAVLTFVAVSALSFGSEPSDHAWALEKQGDAAGARDWLKQEAQKPDASVDALTAWAEYLDEHRDPGARAAWEKALAAADAPHKLDIARRLVILDLIAGDPSAAATHIAAYRGAGGRDLSLPVASIPASPRRSTIQIPGPLASFERMAAIAPDLDAQQVMTALTRNVVTNGYEASNSTEALEQTEYLKLIIRYLSQARELSKLAGAKNAILIETCDSKETGDLLRILGYRIRGACGADLVLETVNPTRAFLTIDSGFPLAELEQALRTNRPFTYAYRTSEVPVLYTAQYWMSARDAQSGDLLEYFLSDPSLCRLYLAMSKLDPATADELRRTAPAARLRIYAHVLDFYGGMFEIRNGHAVTPGGARSARAWGELAGVSPDKGAAFFEKLIARDDGWLASYYDSLARIAGPTQDYLTEPARLNRFYQAIRGKVTSPGPARPVFRANTEMLLLTARLRVDANGKPAIPGNIDVWKNLFIHHPHGKYDGKLTKSAAGWRDSDDVLEALFALCRKTVENEPLRIFMAISDLDRGRTTPLDPQTVDRLARSWRDYGAQYAVFAEVHEVSAATLNHFLDVAAVLGKQDNLLHADEVGTLQALVGLWQIFYRQGSLPASAADRTLAEILNGMAKVTNDRDLFVAGRAGVRILLQATGSNANADPQERTLDLLAGRGDDADSDVQTRMIQDMMRVFEAQRLISMSDLFAIADNLDAVQRGGKADQALVSKAAARISETQLPRASLSSAEKNAFAPGYWTDKHIEVERKFNLKAALDRAGNDPKKLDEIRASLAPLLRDTLVGMNYVYYTPPGAQILITNPLFVRNHDFLGPPGTAESWKTTEVQAGGWPTSSGGKLVGSLAELPYALALAEENFLVPAHEQALIWGDLVPEILAGATVPRWWKASPAHLHWVSLHMDYGETLLAEAALNPGRAGKVLSALGQYAPPSRVAMVNELLQQGAVRTAIAEVMPAELFDLARTMAAEHDDDPLAREIRRMQADSPAEINYAVISRLFGTPKPTIANSFSPQLLSLRTFPALMGYSSRILAETWESSLLYYATLADDMGMRPAQLNLTIPAWTQQTVQGIFATHLEDWPALLRSLRSVGDDAIAKSHRETMASGVQ